MAKWDITKAKCSNCEELEDALEYWRPNSAAGWDKCEEHRIALDALAEKLAKALEALEGVRSFVRDLEPYADQGHTLAPALEKACNILEELKGQGDA